MALDLSKVKTFVVHGANGVALAAVAVATNIFHNSLACLQTAYADIGKSIPQVAGVADSLSAEAAKSGVSDPGFLAVAALFAGVSALIGYGASKLPVWGSK